MSIWSVILIFCQWLAYSDYRFCYSFYILRVSSGTKVWHNVQNDSPFIYKKAVIIERLAKKLCKQRLDINFLVNCGDGYVYRKLTQWKNIKSNSVKYKSGFYRKILLDGINTIVQ